MLALYKQYLYDSDINFIDYYHTICKLIKKHPIIFTDKVQSFIQNAVEIPVFSTLYLSKIQSEELVLIVWEASEMDIVNKLGINNVIIHNNMSINEIITKIRSMYNDKL